MKFLAEYFTNLWGLFAEMAPWLLFGFLLAGILKVFFPQDLIKKYIGKNSWRSVINAALFGIPMPLCSCGVVPMGISLKESGASKGAVNAFLISTPQTGVDSIFATYSLMGAPFAILRPIVALFTGIIGGLVTNFITKDEKEVIQLTQYAPINYSQQTNKEKIEAIFKYGFITMLEDIVKWLVVGLLVAALISTIVPEDFFKNYIQNQWLELFVVLLISIPIYVCATGSIPIAIALLAKGISPGAALLFLMAGPATNIATITMLSKTLGRKGMLSYLFSIIFGTLFFVMIINLFFQEWVIENLQLNTHQHHHHLTALEYLLSFILLSLILYVVINKYYIIPKKNKLAMENTANKTIIDVQGMSCNHCVSSIENGVIKIQGVATINASLSENKVFIEGSPNLEQVKAKIRELGFTVS